MNIKKNMAQKCGRGKQFKQTIQRSSQYQSCRVNPFLVHLAQRSRWTIAITWRPSSVFCFLSSVDCKLFTFQASSPKPIGTKLSRNVPWMVLYKVNVFRSSRIFNMAARANNMLWLAEISKIFFSETNELTEPKL